MTKSTNSSTNLNYQVPDNISAYN